MAKGWVRIRAVVPRHGMVMRWKILWSKRKKRKFLFILWPLFNHDLNKSSIKSFCKFKEMLARKFTSSREIHHYATKLIINTVSVFGEIVTSSPLPPKESLAAPKTVALF